MVSQLGTVKTLWCICHIPSNLSDLWVAGQHRLIKQWVSLLMPGMGPTQCGSSGGHLQIQCSHQHLQILSKNFKFFQRILKCISFIKQNKTKLLDFPDGPVVRNPLANAGDTGFSPWSGKIPYATGQLSLWATTTESVLCNKRNLCHEKPAHCS